MITCVDIYAVRLQACFSCNENGTSDKERSVKQKYYVSLCKFIYVFLCLVTFINFLSKFYKELTNTIQDPKSVMQL